MCMSNSKRFIDDHSRSYNLRECINPEMCDFGNPDDLQESIFCQPYPISLFDLDTDTIAARAFAILASLIGFFAFGLVLFSTSMKLKKRTCVALIVMLFLSCLFGGLQFLFLRGAFCGDLVNKGDGNAASALCTLNTSGYSAVAAVVLWFVALVGSCVMLYTY